MEQKEIQQKKSILLGLKLINDWLNFQTEANKKQIEELEKELKETKN